MCTLLIRWHPGAGWPLVAGAIRDEFTERPWDPPGRHWGGDLSHLLGGRDRAAGGTWMAVDPGARAFAALLNGARRDPLPDDSARPTRGTLALDALVGRTPTAGHVGDHDGFHLVLAAALDGVTVWSWDGDQLLSRRLEPGHHILVNGGIDVADPLVPHFMPLLSEMPDPVPSPGAGAEAVWGPWLELMSGAGLAPDDERALVVDRLVDGRRYGSTSASLVAVGPAGTRYDFTATPADPLSWHEVPTA